MGEEEVAALVVDNGSRPSESTRSGLAARSCPHSVLSSRCGSRKGSTTSPVRPLSTGSASDPLQWVLVSLILTCGQDVGWTPCSKVHQAAWRNVVVLMAPVVT